MKRRFRIGCGLVALTMVSMMYVGCVTNPEKLGLSYRGQTRATEVRLLVDETWVDASGTRRVRQEIFQNVFDMIDAAERFVLIDMFLLNDFGYQPTAGTRPLSQELAAKLIAKRAEDPEVEITFITDPINTVYGALASPHFSAMEAAGIRVVYTDLDQLRDSNPVYSKPWRLLAKPFGTGPGNALKNPVGEGRVSVRSMLKLLNVKANHRKLVITDQGVLLTSANPHSASSAHWNVALRIDGAAQEPALEMESAVLGLSGAGRSVPSVAPGAAAEGHLVELLSEARIKEKVLAVLNAAEEGARVDLCMFYLSHKEVVRALVDAKDRGVGVRVILDPAKDSFNREKNGVPNRQSAARLVRAGIPLRWANTHGEQCHVKMLYVENADGSATLVLGSCNYTRRNMDNFNCEADAAFTAPPGETAMVRARETFDRWWGNTAGRAYTVEYGAYKDESRGRALQAWWGETTGMSVY